VINALLLLYLSFFKAPLSVCSIIRRTQAKFIRAWGYEGWKIAWVAWAKVCSLDEVGGLGIKDVG